MHHQRIIGAKKRVSLFKLFFNHQILWKHKSFWPSRCSPRSPQHNTLALSFVCCCQVYKELPDVLSCGEQRDGRGAAGQGAVFLLPRSLLAVSLPRKHSVAPPTPRFAYEHIALFGVYPELPASFGVYLTRCSRAKMYQALFSVGSKVIRNTLCAWRRGSLGTRLEWLRSFYRPSDGEQGL